MRVPNLYNIIFCGVYEDSSISYDTEENLKSTKVTKDVEIKKGYKPGIDEGKGVFWRITKQ